MPTFKVTAPDGRQLQLTGDSPPTEQELEEVFSSLGGEQPESPAQPEPTPEPSPAQQVQQPAQPQAVPTLEIPPEFPRERKAGQVVEPPESFVLGVKDFVKRKQPELAPDVDPETLIGILGAESKFDPFAESGTGPAGLGQLARSTAQNLGLSPEERLEPEKALTAFMRLRQQEQEAFSRAGIDASLRAAAAGQILGQVGAIKFLQGEPIAPELERQIDGLVERAKNAGVGQPLPSTQKKLEEQQAQTEPALPRRAVMKQQFEEAKRASAAGEDLQDLPVGPPEPASTEGDLLVEPRTAALAVRGFGGLLGTVPVGGAVGGAATEAVAQAIEIAGSERRTYNLATVGVAGLTNSIIPGPLRQKTRLGRALVGGARGSALSTIGTAGFQLTEEGRIDPRSLATASIFGFGLGSFLGGLIPGAAKPRKPSDIPKLAQKVIDSPDTDALQKEFAKVSIEAHDAASEYMKKGRILLEEGQEIDGNPNIVAEANKLEKLNNRKKELLKELEARGLKEKSPVTSENRPKDFKPVVRVRTSKVVGSEAKYPRADANELIGIQDANFTGTSEELNTLRDALGGNVPGVERAAIRVDGDKVFPAATPEKTHFEIGSTMSQQHPDLKEKLLFDSETGFLDELGNWVDRGEASKRMSKALAEGTRAAKIRAGGPEGVEEFLNQFPKAKLDRLEKMKSVNPTPRDLGKLRAALGEEITGLDRAALQLEDGSVLVAANRKQGWDAIIRSEPEQYRDDLQEATFGFIDEQGEFVSTEAAESILEDVYETALEVARRRSGDIGEETHVFTGNMHFEAELEARNVLGDDVVDFARAQGRVEDDLFVFEPTGEILNRQRASARKQFLEKLKEEDAAGADQVSVENRAKETPEEVRSRTEQVEDIPDEMASAARNSARLADEAKVAILSDGEESAVASLTKTISPEEAARIEADAISPGVLKSVAHDLERAQNDDDLEKIVQNTARLLSPQFDVARARVQTGAARTKLAEEIGISPAKLATLMPGQALNAVDLEAARLVVRASAQRLKDLSVKAEGVNATDDDVADLIAGFQVHAVLLNSFQAAASEAGRALNVLRQIPRESAAFNDAVQDLISAYGGREGVQDGLAKLLARVDTTNTKGIHSAVRNLARNGFSDRLHATWVGAFLLSGPSTHQINAYSNAVESFRRPAGRFFAAGYDATRAAVRGTERQVFAREGIEDFSAMMRALPKAWTNAVDAFKGRMDSPNKWDWNDSRFTKPLNVLGLGKVADLVFRSLKAGDQYFRTLNTAGHLHALAYRSARKALPAGSDASVITHKAQEILSAPPRAMLDEASRIGARGIFTDPSGPLQRRVQGLVKEFPGLRWFVPFVNVPSKLFARAIEATPAGFVIAARRFKKGTITEEQYIEELGAPMLGTGLMMAFGTYAHMGYATGSGPSDPEERRALESQGWQPYSIRVGDEWVQYQRFGPLGIAMGMAADFVELFDVVDDPAELAAKVGQSLTEMVKNQPFLQGMTNIIKAMEEPDRFGTTLLQGFARTTVPALVGQVGRAGDPDLVTARGEDPDLGGTMEGELQQFAESMKRAAMSQIPGIRQRLPKVRDMWGRTMRVYTDIPGASFAPSPFRRREIESDPLTQEVVRLERKIGQGLRGKKIEVIPKKLRASLSHRGITVDLSPEEFDELQATAGQLAREAFEEEFNSPAYADLTDGERAQTLKKVFTMARIRARQLLIDNHDKIVARIEKQARREEELLTQ